METIRVGASGDEVTDVQRRLIELELACDGDDPGVFGAATLAAVRTFQQQRGLLADGVVGEETWRELVEAGFRLGDRNLYTRRPMLRGDDVRELQERLSRLGFDAGPIDGLFGPQTERGLRDFQLNIGVAVDGIAGPDTFTALRRFHRQHQSAPSVAVREREAMRRGGRASLGGARVMVDPGHGPDDPGFESPHGDREHAITWAIANRIAGRLAALGANVVLSRGPRTTPTTSQRARLANREGVEAVLSIHLNGLDVADACGAAAYYFGQSGVVSETGRLLAQLALDGVVAATGALNCRTHPSAAALLRETRAPAVIVEPGFLSHPDEGRQLREPAYQDLIAAALTDALTAFLAGAGDADPLTAAS